MHVRLSLVDSVPPVTRDIAIESGTTLDVVHLVIQVLFDWQNVHLHRFDSVDTFEQTSADVPEPRSWVPVNLLEEFNGEPDTDTTLAEALAVGGGELWYEYDFGDSWRVTITGIDGGETARCVLAAAGRPPQDDSGGIHTFNDVRNALPADLAGETDIDALDASVQTLLATTRTLPLLRPLSTASRQTSAQNGARSSRPRCSIRPSSTTPRSPPASDLSNGCSAASAPTAQPSRPRAGYRRPSFATRCASLTGSTATAA